MNLTEEQQAIVESTEPRAVCIACPGSGKTQTLVSKIAHEIRQGVDPRAIIAITFTRAGAGELEERISSILGESELIRLGFCGTLHAFCVKLLQEHLGEHFSVIDERQAAEMLEAEAKHLRYKGSKKDLAAALKKGFREIMGIKTPDSADLVVKGFFIKLKLENLFTFDMLLDKGLEVIQEIAEDPAGSSWKFTHLFVDEFQDSGPTDAAIYWTMPLEKTLKVGDPRQAIYGFRGGDVSRILREIEDPLVKTFGITKNFRSTKEIVEHANRLIPALDPMSAVSGQDGLVWKVGFKSQGIELSGVTDLVLASEFSLEDCAILLRTNWLAQEWIQHLKVSGVPVRYREAPTYPEDWFKLRDYLALLGDPDNDRLAFRAIEHSKGRATAVAVLKDASREMQTINAMALHLPHDLDLEGILNTLQSMGIASGTLELVSGVCREGGEVKTAREAILRLSELDFEGKETGEGVFVGTIHSSKGRQWASVFLPSLEEGILPSPKGDLDEELRLLYVGMTRAEYELGLSYSESRENRFTHKMEPRLPSRFLENLL